MSAYDSPMTVGKMPNGQPCIRLPRGLVATMEAGSDAAREADAAEVARRWNTHADLLDALMLTVCALSIAFDATQDDGIGRVEIVARAAIAKAQGGAR